MVAWISGVFFLGRILIYLREASLSEEKSGFFDQLLQSGARRATQIIIWPAMTLTLISGLTLMILSKIYMFGWFYGKCLAVVLLISYTFYLDILRKQYLHGNLQISPKNLRLLNEVPFIFLIFITTVIISRSLEAACYALLILAALLILGRIIVKMLKSS